MSNSKVIRLPAPGRPPRTHVTAGRFDKAMEWLMLLRRYQAEGRSFDDALEAANAAFAPRPPGRRRTRDDGSVRP